MTAAKKKRTKKATKKKPTSKVNPAVKALMHRRDEYWAGRVGDLRGEHLALVKAVTELKDQLDALEGLAANTSRATASQTKRLSDATSSMSAWRAHADEWSKRSCEEVANAFKAAARYISKAGAGTDRDEEVAAQAITGAFTAIRSGLKTLEEELEEEEQ